MCYRGNLTMLDEDLRRGFCAGMANVASMLSKDRRKNRPLYFQRLLRHIAGYSRSAINTSVDSRDTRKSRMNIPFRIISKNAVRLGDFLECSSISSFSIGVTLLRKL
jgi:hypothetical protein